MADESVDETPTSADEQPTPYTDVADQILLGVLKHVKAQNVVDGSVTIGVKFVHTLLGTLKDTLPELARFAGKTLSETEEVVLPIFAAFVAPIVANLFGTSPRADAFASRDNREARGEGAREIVNAYVDALLGAGGGSGDPGVDGAKDIATAAVHASLEGWFNELIPHILGELIPWDWLHFEQFTGLSEEIIRTLGVGRLVRRAFAPLVDATAATPMKWAMAKTYRQNLLSEGTAVRLFLSGAWSREQLGEELARTGYSEDRIEALITEHAKYLSLDDALELVRYGTLTLDGVLEQLRKQGYDDDTAHQVLVAGEQRRAQAIRDDALAALRSAFVDRRLSDSDFRTYLPAILYDENDRDLYFTAAATIRAVNTKRLTLGQVEAAVKAGILAMPDYRKALELEGYSPDDALTLELLLRADVDKVFQADQARAAALEQRAAAQHAKDDAAAVKKAAAEQQRAIARRGSLAELEHAAVVGLIPIARVEEVLAQEFDADTVAIYVADITTQRADYQDKQQQRADALKRAATKQIDVGSLEAAVLEHVLTVEQYQSALAARGFAAGDVQILADTLRAKLADKEAAQKTHDQAAADAKVKHIDLAKFETLVRRGHRTLADYDALLASLGYDDASRAALHELLQLEIDDDQAAAKARAAGETSLKPKGLSLEQFKRGVVLGLRTIQDYDAFLVANNFTPDAVALLVAEAQHDRDTADAARSLRTTTSAGAGARRLPLSVVTKAARLGVISLDTYRARLVADGYSADDVELEIDLLLTEMAQTKSTQAKAAAAAGG